MTNDFQASHSTEHGVIKLVRQILQSLTRIKMHYAFL